MSEKQCLYNPDDGNKSHSYTEINDSQFEVIRKYYSFSKMIPCSLWMCSLIKWITVIQISSFPLDKKAKQNSWQWSNRRTHVIAGCHVKMTKVMMLSGSFWTHLYLETQWFVVCGKHSVTTAITANPTGSEDHSFSQGRDELREQDFSSAQPPFLSPLQCNMWLSALV